MFNFFIVKYSEVAAVKSGRERVNAVECEIFT